MKINAMPSKGAMALRALAFALWAMTLMPFSGAWAADSLYITDGGDDTVKRFNASTGAYQGTFVGPGSGGLNGPRGLIFTQGRLVVANQNVDQAYAGEILNYGQTNGGFLGALASCNPPLGRSCDANAPFAPRGLIRGNGSKVYVADHDGGRVARYDSGSGAFLGNLDTTGFSAHFFPRGIVRGPDGLLFVSVTGLPAGDSLAGYVLRFNPKTGKFVDIFASHQDGGCAAFLHRPEGLVFGPDRRLYVTAFRADAGDTDKVLIFDGRTGACLDRIDLDQAGQPRSFAQSLLFGPKGRLFVPINNTGEVRRYNVRTKAYEVFVPAAASGGPLLNPWFLSFGETDPRTLGYED